jgi:phosphohistidine phosphatase
MKTLLLVRHAKSSWDTPGLSDFERPLNERGKKDAPEMAQRVKDKLRVDLFVSSPAKRAKRTARIFAEIFGVDKDDMVLVDELYLAGTETFRAVVAKLSDEYQTIALFSHNPGITQYANTLSNVRVDDMPTCAVYAVQAACQNWNEFNDAEKQFLFFDYPKNPLM